MPTHPMERIFGAGAFERERKVAGTRPGEEASVRYVSFDDPASIPTLFHEVLNKPEPYLVDGGAILEGTKLELPDGSHFFCDTGYLRRRRVAQASRARRKSARPGHRESARRRRHCF